MGCTTMFYVCTLSIYEYLWLHSPLLCLGCYFSFLNFYAVGRTPWTGVQPVARTLPAHRKTRTQTSMSQLGFEPTIPLFERAKTVRALGRAATVFGASVHSLTHGAEPFLRSRQLCSYSRTSQHFMEPGGSSPRPSIHYGTKMFAC
jgi:hypothetical protein